MTYASLLINTCTVRRYTEALPRDAYGNLVKTWADHLVGEPCRLNHTSGVEIKVGAKAILIYDVLYVNDIDITTWDRVVIDGDTYDVIDLAWRQDSVSGHHKKCYLVKVE